MSLRRRAVVAIAAFALVFSSMGVASPAFADDYPSWDDVQKARQNETSKAAEIDKINGLIDQLSTRVAEAQSAAVVAANAYQEALDKATAAEEAQATLETQLAAATEKAAASQKQAGSLFARLGRMNNGDSSAGIFVDAKNADQTLYKLGALSQLTSRSADVLENAKKDANQVTALTDQAKVAATELEALRADAETKLQAANDAASAAQDALSEQEQNEDRLTEQLASLKGTTAEVEKGYQDGVAARKAAAEAAARAAAEAAARAAEARRAAAAAAAAQANAGGGGGGGGGGGAAPAPAPGGGVGSGTGTFFSPSAQGWWRPAAGGITSWYGPRQILCGGTGCSTSFHYGIDFGGGCGSTIKAAAGGRVSFVGNAGAFGNRVIIDHGGGVQTVYGHILGGSTRVSVGQQVSGGQAIAAIGRTGVATGCHLDLKVQIGGAPTNPATYLRARGVVV
jgi:murein DD-endopeptidase MepM/ murein hydrolase activator NlpD